MQARIRRSSIVADAQAFDDYDDEIPVRTPPTSVGPIL
jgi:hypothetical protein